MVNLIVLAVFVVNSIYLVHNNLAKVKEYPRLQDHYYNNPCYVIAICLQNLLVMLAITGVTFMNWVNATQFKTTKEMDAEYRVNYRIHYNLNVRFMLANLKKFLTYSVPESEIGF